MLSRLKNNLHRKIMTVAILVSFFSAGLFNFVFAATAEPAQIQRSQEILQEDKTLRERIEKDAGVFIKAITVKGGEGLSEEKIKAAVLPYCERRLTQKDIQELLTSVTQLYIEAGHKAAAFDLQYEVQGSTLGINIINAQAPEGQSSKKGGWFHEKGNA